MRPRLMPPPNLPSLFVGILYGERLAEAGIEPSVVTRGDAFFDPYRDNG